MAESSDKHLCVIFGRFGPYHEARVVSTERLFHGRGWALSGIEIAPTGKDYEWDVCNATGSYKRLTLFRDQRYERISQWQIGRAVWRTLNREQPTVVAIPGWSEAQSLAAFLWCKRRRRIAILMSESKKDDGKRTWWLERMKSSLVRRFDAALVGGSPQREYVLSLGLGANRAFLGYDAVDNEYFRRRAAEVRADLNGWRAKLGVPEKFFLTCCRFIPKKNVARLLDAYRQYRSAHADGWGLVICGGGRLEKDLKARARDLGLDDVVWPGFVQIDDLPKYYGLASAFVLASTVEQWGLVVNEAMASGLPVVVSKTVGSRYDLVRNGENGCIFDPCSVDEMAECFGKLSSLSEEERTRMGERSQEIIKDWGPDRFAQGLWKAVSATMEAAK